MTKLETQTPPLPSELAATRMLHRAAEPQPKQSADPGQVSGCFRGRLWRAGFFREADFVSFRTNETEQNQIVKATSVRRDSWKRDCLEYARAGEWFEVRNLVEAEDINFCTELAEKHRLSLI